MPDDPVLGPPPGSASPIAPVDPILGAPPPDLPTPSFGAIGAAQEGAVEAANEEAIRLSPAPVNEELRLASRLHTELADAPAVPFSAFDAESRQRGYVETIRAISDTGVGLPAGAVQDHVVDLADKLTQKFLRLGGMENIPDLSPKHIDRLRGAFLHNLIHFYAEPSAEELSQVNERAITMLGGLVEDRILGLLNEAEDPEEVAELQQDAAVMRSLGSRAGDPRIQSYFLSAFRDAAIHRADKLPPIDMAQDEAEILAHMLEAPYRRALAEESYSLSPLTRDVSRLLQKHLKTVDPRTGKSAPLGVEGVLQLAYRGALLGTRADRLGVPAEVLPELSPEGSLFWTHRTLVAELAELKSVDLATRAVDAQLSEPEVDSFIQRLRNEKTPEETIRNEITNRVFPTIAEHLLFVGEAPLRQIAENLSTGDETAVQQGERLLQSFFSWIADGVRDAGDAFSTIEGVFGEARLDAFDPALTAGVVWQAGNTAAAEGLRRGEERAQLIIPDSPLRDGGAAWMRKPSDMYFYELSEDGTYRGRVTRQGMEVFLENPNFVRLAGFVGFEERAAELIASEGERKGFGPEVLQAILAESKAVITDDAIDKMLFRGFRTEDVEAAGQGSRRAWGVAAENPNIRNISRAALASLVTGFVFVGNDTRELTKLMVTDPELVVGLNILGGSPGAVRPILNTTASPLLNRVRRLMSANRARFVLREALQTDGEAVIRMRPLLGRLMETGGSKAKYQALEAATNALDHITKIRRDRLAQEANFIVPQEHLSNAQMRGAVTTSAKRAQKIVRHMQPEDIGDLLSTLKLEDHVKHWVQNPRLLGALPELARAFNFRVGKRRLRPSFLLNTQGAFQKIVDNPFTDIADFPIAVELMDNTQLPFWRRALGQGTEAANFVNMVGRFVGEFRDDILAVRALNAERWSNVDEFLDFVRVEAANDIRYVEMARSLARNPGDLADLDAMEAGVMRRLSQAEALQPVWRSRKFDRGINVSRVPVFEETSLPNFVGFLLGKYGPEHFYQKMRQRFETQADFNERFVRVMADPESPAALREKQRIMDNFFSSPGISQRVFFDAEEGVVSHRRMQEILRPERQAVRAAARRLNRDVRPGEEEAVLREGVDEIQRKMDDIRQRLTADFGAETAAARAALKKAQENLDRVKAGAEGDPVDILRSLESDLNSLRREMRDSHPDKGGTETDFRRAFQAFENAKRDLDVAREAAARGELRGEIRTEAITRAEEAVQLARERLDDMMRRANEVPAGLSRALDDLAAERDRIKRLLALMMENSEEFSRRSMQDLGDAVFGLRSRQDLTEFWSEMNDLAALEIANHPLRLGAKRAGNWLEFLQHIHDGKLQTTLRATKEMGLGLRATVRAYHERLDAIQRVYDRLTPAQKEVLDIGLVIARDEGITAPLEALREQFPDYFRLAHPRNADEAVQGLWDEVEDFRKSFLADMHAAGALDKETFDFLVKPYAPRLFSVHQTPRLFPTEAGDFVDLYEKTIPGMRLTMGELAAQRHIRKYKAQLYPGTATGGTTAAPVTQLFETLEDAQRWLRDNFGVKREYEGIEDAGALRAKTGTGDDAVILQPLGEEAAARLGEIAPGAGMFVRLRDTVDNMLTMSFYRSLARKGLSLAPSEFDRLALESRRQATNYRLLPNDRIFGPLAGRYVRKEVLQMADEFTFGRVLRESLHDALENETRTNQHLLKIISGAGRGLLRLAGTTAHALTHNHIAKSLRVILTNAIGDNLLFATLASDLRINTSARGWRAGTAAVRDIVEFRMGRLKPSELPARMRLAMELGIIDEQLFGRTSVRNRNIQAIFGRLGEGRGGLRETRGRTPLIRPVAGEPVTVGIKPLREIPGDVLGAAEAFLAPLRDPRRVRLLQRDDELTRILADESLTVAERKKFVVEKGTLENLLQKEMGPIAKTWARAMNLMRWPLGRQLRAVQGGPADVERWANNFYGDIGNATRLRVFYYLLDQGVDPDIAAQRIDRFMQTYSKVPAGIQRFSKSVVGTPVLSFPYELGRISWNALRHRPGLMAGIMAAGMGRNFLSMAAAGQNPYSMLAEFKREGGSDLRTPFMFMSRQMIPLDDGSTITAEIPGLAAYENFFELYGAVGGATRIWDDPTAGPLEATVGGAANAASKFLFGNPITNALASLMFRRDPRTGDIQRDTVSLLSDNATHALQFFTPSWTPYIGSATSRMEERLDAPRHAYSRRRIGLMQTMAQQLFGIKFRGDLTKLIPDSIEPSARRTVRAIALIQGLELPDDPGRLFGEDRGLDVLDLLSTVRALTAPIDPGGGQDAAAEVDEEFRDVRRAIDWMNSESPEIQRAGAELLAEAEARFLEKGRAQTRLNEPGLQRRATPRDFRNLVRSASRLLDERAVLDNMSLQRRTAILTTLDRYGARTLRGGDQLMKELWMQYVMTGANTLRAPSVPAEIEGAIRIVDENLRAPTMFTDVEELQRIRRTLRRWRIGGIFDERRRNIRERSTRAAIDLLERAAELRE